MKLIDLYHRLPPVGRNVIASLRGYQLRSWRYGKLTDKLVAEARERDYWPQETWSAWQEQRLEQVLYLASTKVPYYRENLRTKGQGEVNRGRLSSWPILKKEALRNNPESFFTDGYDRKKLWCEHTSGTTGTPLSLWLDCEAIQRWYALDEARWRGWYGVSRHDRWAILGGQLICPVSQTKPPFWVWNSGLNQLYLSSYHISRNTCASYVQALREKGVLYLWGYASALSTLAFMALDQGLTLPKLRFTISNAEPLYTHQREMISRAFNCPVHDTYGMCETVCAASECEHGRMHLWPETGIAEVLEDHSDQPVPPGSPGRLVCTGLLNRAMPLIRYETGDRVRLAPPSERCQCGRSLPLLLSVEGRCDDEIVTPDGRRIGRLDPVFKSDIPIREAQIIQESLDLLRIIVVPGPGFSVDHEHILIQALSERVVGMRIQLEKVSEIARSANGKFRAVISKVKASRNKTLET